MLLFTAFLLVHFIADPPHSHSAWRTWIMGSGVRAATAVLFAAMLAHVWVGLRDVLMDYVHPTTIRIGLLGFAGVSLVAIGAWAIRILWM